MPQSVGLGVQLEPDVTKTGGLTRGITPCNSGAPGSEGRATSNAYRSLVYMYDPAIHAELQ